MSESEIVSHSVESDSLQHHGPQPISLLSPWDFLGKNTEVGCHSLLQMIFPTQGLNRDLLHCGQILYSLSHQGSPGASWADHKSKKKIFILKCHLLLFYATTLNHFSIRLWCATKSGLYITTSSNQLGGQTKKKLRSTSQSQICNNKRSWTLFGGLLLV